MKKLLKRLTALSVAAILLCLVLPIAAVAEEAEIIEWDGRTPLVSGTSYIISTQVRLGTDLTIPEDVIITIEDGGSLLLMSGMTLNLRGTLTVMPGGALELRRGNLNLRGSGTLFVLGSFLQYTDTAVNVFNGSINVRNGGEYICSANINLYLSTALHISGSLTLTESAAMVVSGTFTISEGALYRNFGDFTRTQNGTFIDRNITKETIKRQADIPREYMTAAILANEPRVEILGIDVSHWQGDIDWELVATSDVEFVMIRAGRGHISSDRPMIEDTRFREYIEGALAVGLEVGVYFYSYARSVAQAREEAEFLVEIIDGLELTYPVVFDIEDPIHERMSMELITAMTETFIEVLIENGYFPMIYSYMFFLNTKIEPQVLDTYAVWLAQWTAAPTYARDFYIWQFTDKGRIPGINGDVDLNISYIDFPAVLRKYGLNNL